MTDKVRIGVIGLGIMGEQYVRIYNAHPMATVTAISTRGQRRLDEIGDKYGIKTRVTDYHQLLAQSNVDCSLRCYQILHTTSQSRQRLRQTSMCSARSLSRPVERGR